MKRQVPRFRFQIEDIQLVPSGIGTFLGRLKEMIMKKEDLRIVYMGTPEFAVEPCAAS